MAISFFTYSKKTTVQLLCSKQKKKQEKDYGTTRKKGTVNKMLSRTFNQVRKVVFSTFQTGREQKKCVYNEVCIQWSIYNERVMMASFAIRSRI